MSERYDGMNKIIPPKPNEGKKSCSGQRLNPPFVSVARIHKRNGTLRKLHYFHWQSYPGSNYKPFRFLSGVYEEETNGPIRTVLAVDQPLGGRTVCSRVTRVFGEREPDPCIICITAASVHLSGGRPGEIHRKR